MGVRRYIIKKEINLSSLTNGFTIPKRNQKEFTNHINITDTDYINIKLGRKNYKINFKTTPDNKNIKSLHYKQNTDFLKKIRETFSAGYSYLQDEQTNKHSNIPKKFREHILLYPTDKPNIFKAVCKTKDSEPYLFLNNLKTYVINAEDNTVYIPKNKPLYKDMEKYAVKNRQTIFQLIESLGYKYELFRPNESDMDIYQNTSYLKILPVSNLLLFSNPKTEEEKYNNYIKDIYANNPLLGNAIISDKDRTYITSKATNAIESNNINDKTKLSIALAIIYIAQNWEVKDGSLWEYIIEKLGFKFNPRIYDVLTKIVKEALTLGKRFFVDDTKHHDYYNSVLIHALAPKESFFAYFDLMFDFYKEILKDNYNDSDEIINKLINQLRHRLLKFYNNTDTSNKTDPDENIISNNKVFQIGTGIKILIKYKPDFMSKLSQNIIKDIHNINEISKETYLDLLLNEWKENLN